jgi:hypothetical protein
MFHMFAFEVVNASSEYLIRVMLGAAALALALVSAYLLVRALVRIGGGAPKSGSEDLAHDELESPVVLDDTDTPWDSPRPAMRLAMRCHPCVPVEAVDLESWFSRRVAELREAAPSATVRLLRIAEKLPTSVVSSGWLLELEIPDYALPFRAGALGDTLADLYRDLRFLGLEPTLLAPKKMSDLFLGSRANGDATTPVGFA